ncbi:Transcription factor bHLH92 [Camellia lanceoleosa]|uniref:Transcription factor bHLH92 n=1 Tax=Camellia lanceoleosa TaxID=1840588 RepID=A0ACC0HF89_9ERIC|nr:Transcription factor bHLH92 [Camellia lanceoleosa]
MEEFFQYGSRSPIYWIEDDALPTNQSGLVRCTDKEEVLPVNQSGLVGYTNQEEALPVNQSALIGYANQEEALPVNQSGFVRYANQEEAFVIHTNQEEALPVKQSAFVRYPNQEEALLGNQSAFALPVKQSAFVRYKERPVLEGGFGSESWVVKLNNQSVNKRMIEFLRKNWSPMMESKDSDRERSYRHMINERMRRERQKHSYSGLRSLLPPGTKSDKNSIIQVAVKEVQALEKNKAELERRNREIEAILGAREDRKIEGAKIRLRVADPSSGIDSMLEVLKCLKNMGCETIAIQSIFSDKELSAVLEIETQIDAEEVEKAVQRKLFEVEMKLRTQVPI